MDDKLDVATPVLVGVCVAQQRIDNPQQALQAWELMTEAVNKAAADAGSDSLLSQAQMILVPKGIWQYSDPGRLIADRIGASDAKTVVAEIGILQQSLIADACQRIAKGSLDVAIVVGGEAKYRDLRARITGVELNDLDQAGVQPDSVLKPEDELWSVVETNAGLGMPVGYYAMIESALCHHSGRTVDEHRDVLAAMYERFSAVAADNPDAWTRTAVKAQEIRNSSASNKMLAFPYTKYHNSQWNVDQAAALIICSEKKARELQVPEHKWVFPLACTESNHMVNVAQRRNLHRSPGARIAGERALQVAGVGIDDIDYIELYSCFPAAVEVYAGELGIALDKQPLTVTGGMTFAGGPLNNYVLQATCKMAELLRAQPASVGLISSVSGMLTKQAFALWSGAAGNNTFEFVDVSEEVRTVDQPLDLVADYSGVANITAYTVIYNGDTPSRAIVVATLPDGRRTVVYSENEKLMHEMMHKSCCNLSIDIANGQFELS